MKSILEWHTLCTVVYPLSGYSVLDLSGDIYGLVQVKRRKGILWRMSTRFSIQTENSCTRLLCRGEDLACPIFFLPDFSSFKVSGKF